MPQYQEGTVADGPNGPMVFQGGQWVPMQSQGTIIANPEEGRKSRSEARQDRAEGYGRGDRAFDEADKLRDEFRTSPAVTEYNVALGTYNSALNTGASAQGDQSLITAYAKMLDPNSVVREGEFAVTAGTESAFNRLKATVAKEFGLSQGGMLTPDGRTKIRGEMLKLVNNRYKPAYERDRRQYQRFAQMEGLDPYSVVGEHAEADFPANFLDPPEAPEEVLTVSQGGQKANKLPPAYQDAHYNYLQRNWGNIDPEGYVEFRSDLDRRYGQTPDPAAYRSAAPSFNEVAAQGGSPADLGAVPSPTSELGVMEGALNNAAQTGTGAFLANSGNAMAFGLPARVSGNQNRLEDIRAINPSASIAGELAGGIAGTAATGGGLGLAARGLSMGARGASIAGNPFTANLAFGTTYGATQDGNPYRGAVVGGASALGGDILGRAIGRAMPGAFARGQIADADASVPSVADLKDIAGRQYAAAETAGDVASPNATRDLFDRASQILSSEGRITPKGNLIDADTPVSRAHRLIGDFAGQPMTPTQAGSVRKVLGEGLTATRDGAPDAAQRRLSGKLIDDFDQWADPALPNIADARRTASRYLQAQEIQQARDLAQANASQYTQSGLENATRNAFRNLQRQTIRGSRQFDDDVSGAIQTAAEGTRGSNAMRNIGKFAPTSPMALATGAGAGGLFTGSLLGGGAGLAAGLGVAGLGMGARKLATRQTARQAELAELIARGGPEYQKLLEEATVTAARRGGIFGAGAAVPIASASSRGRN